jgi:hypothetical protein
MRSTQQLGNLSTSPSGTGGPEFPIRAYLKVTSLQIIAFLLHVSAVLPVNFAFVYASSSSTAVDKDKKQVITFMVSIFKVAWNQIKLPTR